MFGTTPGTSGRSSASFLNTSISARKSLNTTSKETPSIANRSHRVEQVLEETSSHVVKALNSPVPVQVQEALRGDLSGVSVKLHSSGWAWLVHGNKALLWRFTADQTVARCYSVGLPSVGGTGAWNADLVTVCGAHSSTQLGVMAAAPCGDVHYWANVLRDRPAPSVDGAVDVGMGQVMLSAPLSTHGVVLMSSEGVLFVVPLPAQSEPSLVPHALHTSRGVLTGFSRRVSSLFFRSSAPALQEGRSLVVSSSKDDSGSVVFVLTSTSLQKWAIDAEGEEVDYDVSLGPILNDALLKEQWFSSRDLSASPKIWNVDMKLAIDYVVVLFAAVATGTTVAEYGLALIKAHQSIPPCSIDGLVRLNRKVSYQAGGEMSLLGLSLQCSPSSSSAAVHTSSSHVTTHTPSHLLLALASEQGSEVGTDEVTFPPPTAILGAGYLDGSLLFFTTGQGVVSVTLTSPLPSSPPPSSTTSTSTSRFTSLVATPTVSHDHHMIPPEIAEGAVEKLRDAFLEYLDGNISEASLSCLQLFPRESFAAGHDTLADVTVSRLSEMVLDERPGVDPGWGEGKESVSGGSVVIIYQLENKLTAHSRYLQFVVDTGLMSKLTSITVRGAAMRTPQLLCEHTEKIVAAIALRKAHSQVVDQAMKQCVQQRQSVGVAPPSLPSHLTHQYLYYAEVVRVDDIIPQLVRVLDTRLHSLSHPAERLQVVLATASAVEGMLKEAIQHRHTHTSLYLTTPTPSPHHTSPHHTSTHHTSTHHTTTTAADSEAQPAYLPWTASPGSSGTRASLTQLLDVLYDSGLRDADTSQSTQEVWALVMAVSAILLGGYQDQILSMERNPALSSQLTQVKKQYEGARERCLSPLLEQNHYIPAIDLAEKFEYFPLLVQLCERAGDRERLRKYISHFETQGFAEFLFKFYLDRGELRKLLSHSEDFPRHLGRFLRSHTHLRWMHYLAIENYSKAHKTLHRLALREKQSLARKKTQMSLSKLALLSSDSVPDHTHPGESPELADLNRELTIIDAQYCIPDSVFEEQGIDVGDMPPLSLGDIIKLCVSEENPEASEKDFLSALDLLLVAVSDQTSDEFKEWRTYIWSQVALKDKWSHMSTDNPLGQLPFTLFFRTVQEAFYQGQDLGVILPSLDSLLASPQLEEAGLARDKHFQFLMTAGFEHIHHIQSSAAT